MGDWGKRLCLCLLCAAMVFCSGCADKRVYVTSFDRKYLFSLGDRNVTVTEYNLVLLEIQRQYENYYRELLGEDIWERETEDGATFFEYVKEHIVLDELVTLEALQLVAEELAVSLTEAEVEEAEKAAADYMQTAGAETISYCRANQDLVQDLMEKYLTANKVIAYYTGQSDLEVSENEARAIRIQVMILDSQETAGQVGEALKNGDSFQTVTERFGTAEPTEYNVVRGELLEEIEEVAFSLGQGECSSVLETENGYCVIYCVNDYLTDLTESNRQNIVRQRIYDGWFSKVQEVREKVSLTLNDSEWDKIRLADNDAVESGFFRTYEKYFGNVQFGAYTDEPGL